MVSGGGGRIQNWVYPIIYIITIIIIILNWRAVLGRWGTKINKPLSCPQDAHRHRNKHLPYNSSCTTEQCYLGHRGGTEGEVINLTGWAREGTCYLVIGRCDSICWLGIEDLTYISLHLWSCFKSFFFLNKVGNKQNQIVILKYALKYFFGVASDSPANELDGKLVPSISTTS